jgi:anaerobic selenocysteine-containing dehydrogenase
VRNAGFDGEGLEPGEQLFDAILESPSGVVFTVDEAEASWARLRTPDGRVHLAIPELLDELDRLATEPPPGRNAEFPFVLSAGERRSFTANTIFRSPEWRKKDPAGSLRVGPVDAERLGIASGDLVRITTKRASAIAAAEVSEMMQPGHISLPNGLGVDYPGVDGAGVATGVAPNELTASEDRDWLAGTPWHKHVPARLERV